MIKVGGIVLAAAVGKVSAAPVCATDIYTGTNFLDNLVVAAVTDVRATGASGAHTQATLFTDLYSGGNKLASATVPSANTYLSGHLSETTDCGKCAYDFYAAAYARIASLRITASYPCGDKTGTDGTVKLYDGWKSLPGTAFTDTLIIQDYACINVLQPAIDAFNLCANNGVDIKTGVLNIQCAPADLLTLDATYNAYTVMMNSAFGITELSAAFTDAYNGLVCKSCFETFMSTITAAKAVLYDGASDKPCSLGTSPFAPDLYSTGVSECLGTTTATVINAIKALQACAGTGYSFNLLQAYFPSAEDRILYTALKPYEAIVKCGDSATTGIAAPVAFDACVLDYSPLLNFTTIITTSAGTGFGKCVANLATAAYLDTGSYVPRTACGSNVFGTSNASAYGCVYALNNTASGLYPTGVTSALAEFFQCSGMELNTVSSVCSTLNIRAIDDIHKSYVPIMEIAMAKNSTTPSAAIEAVNAFADLMDVVEELPCASCYAVLAAELKDGMTTDDKNLCLNPYTAECMASLNVTAALTRFETCSGFRLTKNSANTCTAAEWDIMQAADLQANTFNLFVAGVTGQETHAAWALANLTASVAEANPTLSFRCNHCYEVFVHDFYNLPVAAKNACVADINSATCYKGAALAFQKFSACSGFDFAIAAPETTTAAPTTAATTTAAPTTEAPTTTAAPTTTKAASTTNMVSFVMASLVALVVL